MTRSTESENSAVQNSAGYMYLAFLSPPRLQYPRPSASVSAAVSEFWKPHNPRVHHITRSMYRALISINMSCSLDSDVRISSTWIWRVEYANRHDVIIRETK